MVDRLWFESRCKRARPRGKGCGMDWGDVALIALPVVLADELTDTRRVA